MYPRARKQVVMPPILRRELEGGIGVVEAGILVAPLDLFTHLLLHTGVEKVLAAAQVLFKRLDESPPSARLVILIGPDAVNVIV